VSGEQEIAISQLKGKPENVIASIVEGKMEKFFASTCLMRQPFVKNPDISITDLINEHISKIGENIRVGNFVRFQVGA
ncbi:MAG: elongation factor Ts, partial [Puniceicoccales bacterium]|nr:elongation factor Ts [Puniceicoccales bacterium]